MLLGAATPLCPAGHLPRKGGDQLGARAYPNQKLQMAATAWRAIKISRTWCILPISPLVGEMPGRAEGGAPSTAHAENHPA
ncbi:lytic murein transglycosylase [Rhizobium vallis]|uniref:Lytic murein transglycosylase n=1 Tax=Rhizobium vallis TaxID=634290 RepID=A0A3S0SQP4_9HYPH|nr:lytic murein transglycosylase [Rhizobium vallis]